MARASGAAGNPARPPQPAAARPVSDGGGRSRIAASATLMPVGLRHRNPEYSLGARVSSAPLLRDCMRAPLFLTGRLAIVGTVLGARRRGSTCHSRCLGLCSLHPSVPIFLFGLLPHACQLREHLVAAEDQPRGSTLDHGAPSQWRTGLAISIEQRPWRRFCCARHPFHYAIVTTNGWCTVIVVRASSANYFAAVSDIPVAALGTPHDEPCSRDSAHSRPRHDPLVMDVHVAHAHVGTGHVPGLPER